MMSKKYTRCLLFLVLLVLASPSHASLLSSLLKAAKKTDAPDLHSTPLNNVELSLKQLNLPKDNIDSVFTTKMDANGHWIFTDVSGNPVNDISHIDSAKVVLNKSDLPREIERLNQLPQNTELYIRSGNSLYKLSNDQGWILKAGTSGIRVDNYASLQKALWHYQSGWSPGLTRVVGATESVPSLKSITLPSGISAQKVLQSGSQLRGSTLVFSGRVNEGKIVVQGQEFELASLYKFASDHDLGLIILEPSSSLQTPNRVLKEFQSFIPTDGVLTKGDLAAKFSPQGNQSHYQISDSGKNQVLISLNKPKSATEPDRSPEDESVSLSAHIGMHSMLLLNEDRQKELDARIFSWMPSWVGLHIMLSVILGLTAFGTSRSFLGWIWKRKGRSFFKNSFTFSLNKIARGLILFLLVIPLLGSFLFMYCILKFVYNFFRSLLICLYILFMKLMKPFIYVYKQIRH